MSKDDLVSRFKASLTSEKFESPAVNVIEPEIRTGTQYAVHNGLRPTFQADKLERSKEDGSN